MITKVFYIFNKDIKVSRRESIALVIMVMPVLLAIGILFFTPELNDTTVNLALLKSDSIDHIKYMEKFAKVETFNNIKEIESRVSKRDDIVGMVPLGDGYEIILQGNESEIVGNYSRVLSALYSLGATEEETTAQIYSFNHTVPPLKTMLVNMLISMTVMLSGMLIAISIVGEKSDKTISAINVSPISQNSYIIGKSLMGGFVTMLSIIISLFITGYYDINWFMIILVAFSSLILAMVVGFVQGLSSDDIIEASANVKIIMLPIAGSIAGYELLSEKWQWTMYWSPFYWAYKANLLVLSKTADWPTVLFCTFMVVILSLIIYFMFIPRIRKGLSAT